MKKYLSSLFLFTSFCMQIVACNTTTPEKYFGIAVLNTNKLNGFAGTGFLRQLESPSAVLIGDNGETVPMKRNEVINQQIEFVKTNLEDLKALKETEDAKDMLNTSIELYEYVLPVYKNEYTELAKLYGNTEPKEQILQLSDLIHEKYFPRYEKIYNNLVSFGKLYAEKNSIKVNWGVGGN